MNVSSFLELVPAPRFMAFERLMCGRVSRNADISLWKRRSVTGRTLNGEAAMFTPQTPKAAAVDGTIPILAFAGEAP